MHLPAIALLAAAVPILVTGSSLATVKVVTSIHPVSAIVRQIGGPLVDVTTLVPAGSDPHHFELTPRKAKAIYEADAVFLVGGHFDEWVLPGGGRSLDRLPIIRFHEEFTESLLAMGSTFNPHFWLDPLYAARMGDVVTSTLCSVDTVNCSLYTTRAERFHAEIDSLNASISTRLAEAGFKHFIAFHPAWSYFARRYGLREHGTLEISHEHEPSAKHIGEIVRHMIAEDIRTIVVEEFSNADLAEGVARQTGAQIIYLDPLGAEDTPGRDTYGGILNYNMSVIEESMEAE